MPAIDLNKAYDEIKSSYTHRSNTAKPLTYQQRSYADRNYNSSDPKRLAFRNKAVLGSEQLREGCYRHLLLDIYMKILPFDDGYADGVRGQCKQDVDSFLADKKMTGEDYFKSAYAETKAPFLEYIIRSVGTIGKLYMEGAIKKGDEARDAGIDIDPHSPVERDIEEMTVDIKGDMEYEEFIDRLKKKTVKKIVNDVSKLIMDKKSEAEMVFAPKENARITESAFSVAFEYITESFIKAQLELPKNNDELIGLAIRESTLNVIDCVFEQQGKNIEHFARKVRMGNGVIINKGFINGGLQDAYKGASGKVQGLIVKKAKSSWQPVRSCLAKFAETYTGQEHMIGQLCLKLRDVDAAMIEDMIKDKSKIASLESLLDGLKPKAGNTGKDGKNPHAGITVLRGRLTGDGRSIADITRRVGSAKSYLVDDLDMLEGYLSDKTEVELPGVVHGVEGFYIEALAIISGVSDRARSVRVMGADETKRYQDRAIGLVKKISEAETNTVKLKDKFSMDWVIGLNSFFDRNAKGWNDGIDAMLKLSDAGTDSTGGSRNGFFSNGIYKLIVRLQEVDRQVIGVLNGYLRKRKLAIDVLGGIVSLLNR